MIIIHAKIFSLQIEMKRLPCLCRRRVALFVVGRVVFLINSFFIDPKSKYMALHIFGPQGPDIRDSPFLEAPQ